MFLTDLKVDDYLVNRVKEIKIIFKDDVAVVLKQIKDFDIDLDCVEKGIFNLNSILYSKRIHEYYNRRIKIKRVVLKLDTVDIGDIPDYNDKNVEIHYDCDAIIRRLRYVYDRELGDVRMEVSMEGDFYG